MLASTSIAHRCRVELSQSQRDSGRDASSTLPHWLLAFSRSCASGERDMGSKARAKCRFVLRVLGPRCSSAGRVCNAGRKDMVRFSLTAFAGQVRASIRSCEGQSGRSCTCGNLRVTSRMVNVEKWIPHLLRRLLESFVDLQAEHEDLQPSHPLANFILVGVLVDRPRHAC